MRYASASFVYMYGYYKCVNCNKKQQMGLALLVKGLEAVAGLMVIENFHTIF